MQKRQCEKFFDFASDPMCVAGTDGYFKKVNPAFSRVLGYSEAELLEKPFIEFIHPEDRQSTLDELTKQLQGGVTLDYENRYVCKDGSLRCLSWHAGFDEELDIIYGIARDITQNKRAEEEIKSLNRLFSAILENSGALVSMLDKDHKFVYWNKGAEQITGYTREEVLGRKSALETIYPDDAYRQKIAGIRQDIINGKPADDLQLVVRKKTGENRTISFYSRPVHDELGAFAGIVNIGIDITRQKHAEETILELNQSLEKRVQAELAKSRKKDQLMIQQSRLAAMGEMIGNIAHQWRQPLSTMGLIMQNIDLDYEDNILDAVTLKGYISNAMLLVNQMSKTIDDFSNYFKPNKNKTDFDLKKAVEAALSIFSANLEHHNIAVIVDAPDNVVASGFANEYSQVLLNLLSNAKDAILTRNVTRGVITIRIAHENDKAVVMVRDNAGGIPQDILPKILEPYFTTKEKGTGIGLYMSKVIMENMCGDMVIQNVGEGAQVLLTLPLGTEQEYSSHDRI